MNSKGDLISREALKEAFKGWKGMDDYYHNTDCVDIPFSEAYDLIDNAPTVDIPTELCKGCRFLKDCETCKEKLRPQGEWIDINKQGKTGDGRTFTFPITTCSVCKKSTGELYNFCPNCGADMKGGAV